MAQTIFTPHHHHLSRSVRGFFIALGILLWATASFFVILPSLPHIIYRLAPSIPTTLAQNIADTNLPTDSSPHQPPSTALPPLDPSLPTQNSLIIPSIKLNGAIHEGDNWEEILRLGIWRTPLWGTPEDPSRAIILASHRWGYLDWTNDFRRKNSFYNLPKLQEGDTVEIIWNQRSYKYQIFASETATTPSRLEADLILYTCQLWNSPVRIFKYARRIN